jgi:hypothetical protein
LMLNVERAISASELGALARGVILASLLVSLLAVSLLISLNRKAESDYRSQKLAQLIRVIANSSFITGILAVFIGFSATYVNQSTLSGSSLFESNLNVFGVWLLLIFTFLTLMILVINKPSLPTAAREFKNLLKLSLLFALISAFFLPLELPRPARSVEATAETKNAVTVTAVLSPGAAGPNDLKVGLTGPDAEVARILSFVVDGQAQMWIITGEEKTLSEPIQLKINDEGSLVAEGVIAQSAGKSKIRIKLSKRTDPLNMNITLQENPGYKS